MKRTWILTAALVLALASFSAGCKKGERMEEKAGERQTGMMEQQERTQAPEGAPAEETKEAASAYQQTAEKKLDEFEARIEEIEQSAGKAGGEAREDLRSMVEDLNKKKDRAEDELAELKAAGMERWEEAKERLQTTMDEIEKGINEALASVK
ncbi:MAG: hypothetical protein Q8P48_03010 [Deltaproteobacteria bacterium]|nr:hypothetical protein [Deltaproteobacteria bacterium]